MQGKKNIIGLMGGIASGKSTVAAELAKLGCAVIDADVIAKQFLLDEEIKKQMRQKFGDDVFDDHSQIDRKKLAKKVFTCRQTVELANSIIHPPVLRKVEQLIEAYQLQPDIKAIVLDIPLLVESGWEKRCDKLIFIDCCEQIRFKRVENRGVFDVNELKKRENFQISLDNKRKIANYVIENSNLSELIKQIGNIFPALLS
ncbi:MAG: dephospho-CoA kinase [Phycisphaerae bacterium]|jgi:dephospho-CoA kinase